MLKVSARVQSSAACAQGIKIAVLLWCYVSISMKAKFSTHSYLIRYMIIIRHTHIIKKGEIYQKPKSLIVWVGETRLLFSFQKLRNRYKSGETCQVTWKIRRVLLVDHQTCKKYAFALVLCTCTFKNNKFTNMYKSIKFFFKLFKSNKQCNG